MLEMSVPAVRSRSSSSTSTAERTSGPQDDSACHKVLEDSRFTDTDIDCWASVGGLCSTTTDKSLLDLFFPYGANDAFTVPGLCGKRVGFVLFPAEEMLLLAIEKMNDFIPCRQSNALIVSRASLAEVENARQRPEQYSEPSSANSSVDQGQSRSISLARLLDMNSATPQHVAHHIQQRNEALSAAEEIFSCIPSRNLRKIADSLTAILPGWSQRPAFQVQIIRGLIKIILLNQPTDVESHRRMEHAGSLLGLLFVLHFAPGDPFELATKLLHELKLPCQVRAISNIAKECESMVFPVSSAGYWATLAGIAATHPAQAIREACSSILAKRYRSHNSNQRSKLSPSAAPFLPKKGVDLIDSNRSVMSQQRDQEARARTVYVSRLAPHVPQRSLMEFLSSCGLVNKVRICVQPGFETLYGFVEMASIEGAWALLAKDRHTLGGVQVRFQEARAPVQDVSASDAVEGPGLSRLRPCTFGSVSDHVLLVDLVKSEQAHN